MSAANPEINLSDFFNRGIPNIDFFNTRQLVNTLPRDAQQFMNSFLYSSEGHEAIAELYGHRRYEEFTGLLFQELAYVFARRFLASNQVLLSPRMTKYLFEHPFLDKHGPSSTGSFPDGLLLEGGSAFTQMAGIYEYTSGDKYIVNNDKARQSKGYDELLPARRLLLDQPASWRIALGSELSKHFPVFTSGDIHFDVNNYSNNYVLARGVPFTTPTSMKTVVSHLPLRPFQIKKIRESMLQDLWS